MLLNALILVTTLVPGAEAGADAWRRALPPLAATAAPAESPPPRFDPATRSVSNWHAQTGAALTPRALAVTASLADDPPYVARCVRLNNGWCIKSARWPGEIGADGEGHTAFATLADGADAAASLLRRYYRDYGRRTALAIVRRWAPAECRLAPARGPDGARRHPPSRRRSPPGASAGPCAPASSQGTGPAGRPGAGRPCGCSPGRRSPGWRVAPARRPAAVPHVAALQPIPDIAVGIAPPAGPARGRTARGVSTRRRSSTGRRIRGCRTPTGWWRNPRCCRPSRAVCRSSTCACRPRSARATRCGSRPMPPAISGSVGLKPGDDLDLFGPDGAPRANLAPVMLAMSAVELGTLRAGPDLVAGAIARLGAFTPAADNAPR